MKLFIDQIFGSPKKSDENETSLQEYVNKLMYSLRKVHDFARIKLQLTSFRMKVKIGQKTKPGVFKNDGQYYKDPEMDHGYIKKIICTEFS